MTTTVAHEHSVQAIGFMYRNYKVLVSLDAKEDVVGELLLHIHIAYFASSLIDICHMTKHQEL